MGEATKAEAKASETKKEYVASQKQNAGLSQSISLPADRILFLQRTIGNEAVGRLIRSGALQAKFRIGRPGDKYEQEADRVADQVMRMPEHLGSKEIKLSGLTAGTPIQRVCPECKLKKDEEEKVIQAKEDSFSTPDVAPELESSIISIRSGGQPLPESVRAFYEPHFGVDFSQVRVHTDSHAAQTAQSINAKAFTVGHDIAFSEGQYAPESNDGRKLLAHELTHTIQQGAGVQRSSEPLVQREQKESSWWDKLTDFGESAGWTLLREYAPAVIPIAQKGPEGIFDMLKEHAGTAVEGIFTSLMTPVRVISGVGEQLSAQFTPLLASVQEAGAKIMSNDCSPLREAAEKIEKTAERLITPIVEKLQPIVTKVKDFMKGLWDKLGAPIWDLIQKYASAQWAQIKFIAGQIQAAANWIWDKAASVRSLADQAWTWLKNKLGIGEGAEGQNGILQWVQRKLDTAWTWLTAKLEPFKKELTTVALVVGGVVLALSPAGPLLAIGAAVAAAAPGLRWIYANWGRGNMIVQARVYLEKTLIPPLQGAANRLGAAVTRMADSITGALGNFAAGMTRAVGSLGGSLLGFAVSAIQWIADQVTSLANWARQQLGQLSQWVKGALDKLQTFLQKMLTFFAKVGNVVLDIWGLPVLLGEQVWNWVPSCIRDPIVDFLGPIILRQIEIFQELVKDNDAWKKTKAEVGKIIRLIFKDHDMMGAIKATFSLILRVFNLPPDLLVTVAKKALSAWDIVIKKPLDFIKNTVRSIGKGFQLLWANILTHLEYGVQGWLFGALAEKNISPPASWTDLKDVFFFVLDVLGLNVDHIYDLLKDRLGEDKVKAVRQRIGQVSRALDWINKTIDTTKSPRENVRGMIDQAKDFGMTILTGIAEWIAGKVAEELAILAAAAAASGGISEVIDVARRIYKGILSAVRWARRILDMANEALDNVLSIASGAIEPVGIKFRDIMHRGMPVVIGFLADQVGLGGVGPAIRNIVDKLRAQVDRAILWLIDKIKAGIEALVGAARAGVAAVRGWLTLRSPFKTVDGQDHSLYFQQRGDQVDLIRASDLPTEILEYLNTLSFDESDVRHSQWQLAKDFAGDIRLLTRDPGKKATTPKQEADIVQKVSNLSRLLMNLVNVSMAQLPAKANWDISKSSNAHHSNVNLLSSLSATGGSAASGTSPEYEFVVGADWVRMHLIPHSVGGPGSPDNWIPAPINVNSGGPVKSFETALESTVRSAAISGPGMRPKPAGPLQPNVVWVESEVREFQAPITDSQDRTLNFPGTVLLMFGLYRPDGTQWVKLDQPLSRQNVRIPPVPNDKIRLSSSSGTAMLASGLPHLSGQTYSNRLVVIIKQVRGAGFSSYDVLEARLLAATINSKLLPPQLISQIVRDLRSRSQIAKDVALK